jgi:8-amino-7-oxononanoate synthase
MGDNGLHRLIDLALAERSSQDRLRMLRTVSPLDSVHLELDGRRFVNFSSNDYLGLSRHPELIEAVIRSAGVGVGSAASPLITGHTALHASAEARIAEWKGCESAVLLPSGYQANHAAIQTLAAVSRPGRGGARFLLDKLVHASLLDAVGASDNRFRIFPHNHLGKLQRLLAQAEPGQLQVVVTESIFSMDGDAADLEGLAELKRRFGFVLLLDEAHATGTYGPDGGGYAAEKDLGQMVDVSLITLSKAMGCMGGAICASRAFIEAVVNFGRSYVYSTSIAPPMAAAAEAAIGIICREPERRERVRALARRVRDAVVKLGLSTVSGDSPIIPVLLGSEAAAVDAEQVLRAEGMLAVAVRPPTVPPGSSRLRITVSSAHEDRDIDQLLDGLQRIRARQDGAGRSGAGG